MLTGQQAALWAGRFGVADAQVRRDHLLSHLLWAVAADAADAVVLIGGTALCRTHLTQAPWVRLSEDLDLLVVAEHTTTAARLERQLLHGIRREFPDAAWLLSPTRVRAPTPAQLTSGTESIRVQMLPASGGWWAWTQIPHELRAVDLRYDDTPGSVDLQVPTLEAFAAMKLAAWEDRQAPRDLFDLAGLTTLDAFNAETLDAFGHICARAPDLRRYEGLPAATRLSWQFELGHQIRQLLDAPACLQMVANAVVAMVGRRPPRTDDA